MKRLALSDNIDTDEVEIINRKEIIEPTGSLPIRNSGNFKGLGWCLFISPFCEYKIGVDSEDNPVLVRVRKNEQ